MTLDNGIHQAPGADLTANNGDTIGSGTRTDALTIDTGNGNHGYTFGDGNHTDTGLANFEKLMLADASATNDHAVSAAFNSSFHNTGTLTADGSVLTHMNGANLTVDAHLAASDSFVINGSTNGGDTHIGSSYEHNAIIGGGGDTITGGGNNDTFVFKAITSSPPGNVDTITDFNKSDHIDFSAVGELNRTSHEVEFHSLASTPDSIAAHTFDIVTSGGSAAIYGHTLAHVDTESHLNNAINVHSTDFILHG